jgi:hypothetical protein
VKYFIEIQVPGTSPQRHELVGERLTLGTGSQASIQAPSISGFEAEQLEIFTSDQGARVQVPTGMNGALVFDGAEHRRVRVPWGGEVFVGNVRLTFLRVSAKKGTSPVLLLVAPIVFIVLGLGAYGAGLPDDVSNREVPAPLLFDEQQVSRCPASEPDVAEHRARDDERVALAKQERSAFSATDGVDALTIFREAHVCFQSAGKAEEAARAADELSLWSGRLNEQYATLRLRLRVALDKERSADALEATKELQGMLAHQDEGPYRQWLVQLARTLERKVARPDS